MFSEKFICATDDFCDYDHPVCAPLFRKKFNLKKMPDAADFIICGLGLYELYINGQKITKGALAPYINNPDDLLYYDRYDLMPYIKSGENVIGIMLGNGFFNCFGGSEWGFDKASWRGPLRLAFSLLITDGKITTIVEADESVRVSGSAVLFDDLRIGAFFDARRYQENWNNTDFDDHDWQFAEKADAPKGKAVLCEVEPVTFYKRLKPVSIEHFDDLYYVCKNPAKYVDPYERTYVKNTYMYDFGENNSGVCRLKIRGEKGQVITLRFGECLHDGKFSLRSTINMGNVKELYLDFPQMDKYILKGEGEEVFLPPFTYHGFRYVLVEGITPNQATNDLLTFEVMASDVKLHADFQCSNETLNRLFDMTCRSDISNLVYIPTDCPHREKNGWTADIALSAEHILLNYSAQNTLAEWLRNVRAAQCNGAFPGIIPTAGWGFEWGNGPGWDSVCVYLPYYIYKYTGDLKIVEDNICAIFAYLQYIADKRDFRGLIDVGLEDWAQPNIIQKAALSPTVFTDSAIIFDIANKTEFLAKTIGNDHVAAAAGRLAKELKDAIRMHLIDLKSCEVAGHCQTSQALALEFGLFEENETTMAFNKLLDYIHIVDNHINCGVIGGRYIFHVLERYGFADVAVKMILNPTYPSYAQWVARGDTTLSEAFTRDGEGEHGFRDSRNHHFWGDISSFFIQCIVGLRPNPLVRDVNEYFIQPNFVEALSFAEATYQDVFVRWEKKDDAISLTVKRSHYIYGKIILPKGYSFIGGLREADLDSGVYTVIRCEKNCT